MHINSCNRRTRLILVEVGDELVTCFWISNLKLNSSITEMGSMKCGKLLEGRIWLFQVFSDKLYINVFLKFPFHNLLIDDDSCPYRNTFHNKRSFGSTGARKHLYIRGFHPFILVWFNRGRNHPLHQRIWIWLRPNQKPSPSGHFPLWNPCIGSSRYNSQLCDHWFWIRFIFNSQCRSHRRRTKKNSPQNIHLQSIRYSRNNRCLPFNLVPRWQNIFHGQT